MRSRLRLRDLSTEAIAGVMQRPGRTILTMLGTVMGVGSFVAVLGLTASATGQVGGRFTQLIATKVTVEEVPHARSRRAGFPR